MTTDQDSLTGPPGLYAPAEPEPLRAREHVRLRTLIFIRWIAVLGQATTLLFVHFVVGFPVPLIGAAVAVAASVVLNLVLATANPPTRRLTDSQATLHLGYDLLQLGVLLYLTGGLANPFAVLMLVPVTISATILSGRSTLELGGLALICVTGLAFYHWPLPWSGGDLELPPAYIFGMWTALVLGTAFIATYAWRVACEARRLSDALVASSLALASEQQLSALGALAAAAAHELGTPLGTIALVAKELSRAIPEDSPLNADIGLLRTEAVRCRDILARLLHRPDHQDQFPFDRLPLSAVIEEAAEPHRHYGIDIDVVADGVADEEPQLRPIPELVHGLGNIIENAVGFARDRVTITMHWDSRTVSITIADDGPGFEPGLIGWLGEPYLGSRGADADSDEGRDDAGGMGLGIFIAKTLLGRTGARLSFANRPGTGAAVTVNWPRASLARMPNANPGTPALARNAIKG